jgi:hypothetical protein
MLLLPKPLVHSKTCMILENSWVERLDAWAHPWPGREVGWADRWWSPACPCVPYRGKGTMWIIPEFSSFYLGAPFFSQEWWTHIRYGVCCSPAVCHWRESIVSRCMCYNRRPMVPRVQDPDKDQQTIDQVASKNWSMYQNLNITISILKLTYSILRIYTYFPAKMHENLQRCYPRISSVQQFTCVWCNLYNIL